MTPKHELKVIVVSGKAGSGKDTAANMLYEFLQQDGFSCLVTHYADPLKFVCKAFFDWDGDKDEGGRSLLQYVGTDVVRARNPDFWVNFIADMLEMFEGQWDFVVIPDTRFPNEITGLRDRGFEVTHLRITRKGLVSKLTDEQQAHSSETALDDVTPDYTLENDEGLDRLEEKITHFAREVLYDEDE